MAVTENKLIEMQDGKRRSFPVNASTRIYQGRLVYLTATGYADDDTATGVNGFAGIAVAEVDNSSGAAGDKYVEVFVSGDFELTGAGTYTLSNIGNQVYGDDNYTVNVAIAATSVPIGVCVGFVSATRIIVRIKPCGDGALVVAPLTTITIADSNGGDYALSALTTTTPYGLATQAEAQALLYVIQNLQQRVLELEKRR
jgi:hypothetical protein